MPNSPEQTDVIDAFLQGRLSPDEAKQMQDRMAADPGLREAVDLQRLILAGIRRAGIREQVTIAKRKYLIRKATLQWALAGLTAAALIGAILYFNSHKPFGAHPGVYKTDTLPQLNEAGENQWADADRYLPAQTYQIDAASDTVIETKQGITLSLQAHTFLDEDNKPASGKVQVILREAVDPVSILQAGLSTRSGDQLLSTGGMFFLDARQENHILHIDTSRPALAQIPATDIQPGMQLYQGQRMPDGTIDWIKPVPLDRRLVTVDIRSLDFYPPSYIGALQAWGWDKISKDRDYSDSLYFSLAAFFPGSGNAGRAKTDTSFTETTAPYYRGCGIDPAKIKAIWTPAFQHTLIATREFQQRLMALHRAGRNDLLDLYIDHLSWDLSAIDSLAATRATDTLKTILLAFAARHDGKVGDGTVQFRKLAEYYRLKARVYADAIRKTEKAFSRYLAWRGDSALQAEKVLSEEYQLNYKAALRQLGYDTVRNMKGPASAVYTVSLTVTGWYNIDKAVEEATESRTTLNYTDSFSGKKAVIRYLPFSLSLSGWKEYDRVFVYLLPDQLSSFQRVKGADGIYKENLNELMKYQFLCIAWKGKQSSYYSQDNVLPRDYKGIRLNAVSEEELNHLLKKAGSSTQSASLRRDASFLRTEMHAPRDWNITPESLALLKDNLAAMIFYCLPSRPVASEGK